MRHLALSLTISAALAAALSPGLVAQLSDPLPRPDGKKADMSKPVQVYILINQSNILNFNTILNLKTPTPKGNSTYN